MKNTTDCIESTSSKPLVTIAIPTFNRYDQLFECLKNVVQQDFNNLEILISDNTDNIEAPNWLLEIVRNEKRIKYVKQKKNLGMIGNDTFIRRNAKGSYLCVIHDDDLIPPNYINALMSVMQADSDCALAGPVGNRFYEGKYWYQYEIYNSDKMDRNERLRDIVFRAFHNSTAFEHLIYGIYRKDDIPEAFQFTRWRSIILFFFLVSIKGSIKTVEDVVLIKNTCKQDFDKYENANYVQRYKIFSIFFPRKLRFAEQRMTVLFRLVKFTYNSQSLSFKEKANLFAYSVFYFFVSLVNIVLNKIEKVFKRNEKS